MKHNMSIRSRIARFEIITESLDDAVIETTIFDNTDGSMVIEVISSFSLADATAAHYRVCNDAEHIVTMEAAAWKLAVDKIQKQTAYNLQDIYGKPAEDPCFSKC